MLDAAEVRFDQRSSAVALARIAHEEQLISVEALNAIEGLSVLRNLAARSPEEISSERASEYHVLVDAVLFMLRR